ncbi:MAG TPA: multiheme c-type cytochrome [Vicinamibacterales bacterium]|nr:multiheme c-type cytochrome [Vicinamibacterales bacterium]
MSLLMLLVAWVASGTFTYAQPAVPADTSGYVWDAACKDCHSEIYDAWAKTRHKTALMHLSAADQEKECVGCHLTGSLKPISENGKVLNAGVQCEACHGAGREHAETAKAGTPVKFAKKPAEAVCVQCHNDKSPRFRGFFFTAMKPLVHKAK